MDEAHRLRNVYKPSNVIANTLKLALAGKHKLLLTATPLQNSLLELFGLVSFIDEHTFGDLKIQVDSSKTGAEEDEMVERLLKVERTDEPTEIVIHVNMLKEGWDVTNLYTIVPLRTANARILIGQSIGRGLRLPYGKRTGVNSVDRLNINLSPIPLTIHPWTKSFGQSICEPTR